METTVKNKTITAFLWRLLQNAGSQIAGFIISIVLARILMPEEYGTVAMITTFTGIAMVFINTGFSSAIVQKKDLSDVDINTMFYSGMLMSFVLYGILFIAAPYIAILYKTPILTDLLRVASIMVILGAAYSVQQALITRNLQFKKSFIVSLCGVAVQGVVGITLALEGFGAWALVFASLSNYTVAAILMWCIVSWKPKFVFSSASFRSMFSFSVKMLMSGILDSIFNNIRSIIIGIRYSSEDLAYYSKGYQFPTLIMTQVDGSMTTVLFSSLSGYQSNWNEDGIRVLRRAMKMSMYICAPLMAGLFAVSDPMIRLLLTDKWADSIIYVRLGAIICLFWPLSAKRHAINSRGKSGSSLALNFTGKAITLLCLLLTYKHSVQLMIASTIFSSLIFFIIALFFYKKHLDYRIRDQIFDVLPSILLSIFMGAVTYSVMFLRLSSALTLLIQIPVGIFVYIIGSILFRFESFYYLLSTVKSFFLKRRKA